MASDPFQNISQRLSEIINDSDSILINDETVKVVNPKSIRKGIVSHGRMFLFKYLNPLGRVDLPYYNLFPPVITFAVRGKYINGANLYYLPKRVRKFTLDILKLRMTKGLTTQPRSLIRYDLIKANRARRAAFAPAIKNYNLTRTGPVALEIHSDLWDEILLGDASDFFESSFRKANSSTVFRDSLRRIYTELLNN
jgi:hypothetical protein